LKISPDYGQRICNRARKKGTEVFDPYRAALFSVRPQARLYARFWIVSDLLQGNGDSPADSGSEESKLVKKNQ
jgi:hypothetical protein